MDGCHASSFWRSIALFPIEPTQHRGERQMVQIYPLQVSAPQIYPLASSLPFIGAIYWSAPALMGREEPLHISAP
jgi:hypothetical protein